MVGRKKLFKILGKTYGKVRWYIVKIPSLIWSSFAVIGIFMFGFLVALILTSDISQDPEYIKQNEEVVTYHDIINSYQGLSKLFYYQSQDMDIIMNYTSDTDPVEFAQAVASYKQKKDEILFQYGRIYEQRLRARIPTDEYLKIPE